MNSARRHIQSPLPSVILGHFHRQIQEHHCRTISRGPRALHYDTQTKILVDYPWPCDEESGRRFAPWMLESLRRTHHFKGPCCLCPFIDGSASYSESLIGVVEVAHHQTTERDGRARQGEYVAVCSRQRCGYFIRLEVFYGVPLLNARVCWKRTNPLPPQQLAHPYDIRSSTNHLGLIQVMKSSTIRAENRDRLPFMNPLDLESTQVQFMRRLAKGVDEDEFWANFVQCVTCKAVMLRLGMLSVHECEVAKDITPGPVGLGGRRYRPYSGRAPAHQSHSAHAPRRPSYIYPVIETLVGDSPESQPTSSIKTRSPTPTDIVSPA